MYKEELQREKSSMLLPGFCQSIMLEIIKLICVFDTFISDFISKCWSSMSVIIMISKRNLNFIANNLAKGNSSFSSEMRL